MCRGLGSGARVHRFDRHDSEVAGGKLVRVSCRLYPPEHVTCAREPQAVGSDRGHVLGPWIVGPDFDIFELSEVGGKDGPHGSAADHADSHW